MSTSAVAHRVSQKLSKTEIKRSVPFVGDSDIEVLSVPSALQVKMDAVMDKMHIAVQKRMSAKK